ncbi:MAG: DUF2721 domain-containing protein [Rhodothermales bacterium]|nr:DUF2721 domain-containing protein [Rhodothermales bacterium]
MDEMNLWLTPLILLPGVALLIISTSGRFNRLHDEVHAQLHRRHGTGAHVAAHLTRRARLFRDALVALYICVGMFSLASFLGMMAALWAAETSAWIVLGITAGGILCLTFAAFQLIRESILSLRVIEDHHHETAAPEQDS